MCYMKINDKNDFNSHFCKYCGYEDNESCYYKKLKSIKFSKEK